MGWFILIVFILLIAAVVFTNLHSPTKTQLKKDYPPGGFIVGVTAPHYAATVEKLMKGEDSK
jgi:hypothetical protein